MKLQWSQRPENKERRKLYQRQWARKNRDLIAAYARAWSKRHPDRRAAAARAWREKNREKWNSYMREWNRKNPDKVFARQLRFLYGITPAQRLKILSKGCCLCHRPATRLDHDHKTGRLRGGLCNRCNSALGLFQDNCQLLRRAIKYIENLA